MQAGGMACDINPACGGALSTSLVDTSVVEVDAPGQWDASGKSVSFVRDIGDSS